MQGGLDWELIAMVAAGASVAIIVWDWFAARRASERSEARKGLLEVAWPVLFLLEFLGHLGGTFAENSGSGRR